MNRLNDIQRARLLELAVERATGGLSRDELRELEVLAGPEARRLDDSLERAAAAIHMASLPPVEPLPRDLAARIAADADRFFAPPRRLSSSTVPTPTSPPLPAWFAWGGWAAAAACCVAVIGLLSIEKATNSRSAPVIALDEPEILQDPIRNTDVSDRGRGTPVRRDAEPAVADDESAVASAAEQRLAMLRNERFVLQRSWAPAGDSTGIGVQGDVLWNARTQRGYLRFTGLRRNDPSQEQYQLWIFDGQRDQRYPVDGGVFDSNGDDELVVPIQPRLAVATPLAFAVTIERAGGVVVSGRQRVVVIARIT